MEDRADIWREFEKGVGFREEGTMKVVTLKLGH